MFTGLSLISMVEVAFWLFRLFKDTFGLGRNANVMEMDRRARRAGGSA